MISCEIKRCRQPSDLVYSAGEDPHPICNHHFSTLSREDLKNPDAYKDDDSHTTEEVNRAGTHSVSPKTNGNDSLCPLATSERES